MAAWSTLSPRESRQYFFILSTDIDPLRRLEYVKTAKQTALFANEFAYHTVATLPILRLLLEPRITKEESDAGSKYVCKFLNHNNLTLRNMNVTNLALCADFK